MKKNKVLFWIFTGLIFIFDGLIPALTSHTELAVEGIRHLGYPDYFRVILTCFKVGGSLILILPFFKGRIKEWAYAGFSFNFIFALLSTLIVDGPGPQLSVPIIAIAVLGASYFFYHRIQKDPAPSTRLSGAGIQLS